MTKGRLSTIKQFTDWYINVALPAWAGRCLDDNALFYEALDFDGVPITSMPRRVRVQSRQIYTFTHAARLGWLLDGEEIAHRAFGQFISQCCPDDGARGCVHLIDDHGAILDSSRDLYDQAFLLLACAARLDAGDDRALPLAESTIAFLDAELAAPNGGYFEDDRHSLPRRQNPHMHLFEALLALHQAGAGPEYLGRARTLYELMTRRFWDADAAVLREYFNADWSLHGEYGARIEPGHMAEWSHLLIQYANLCGADVAEKVEVLLAAARRFRIDHGGAFLPTQTTLARTAPGARRLWPQTELLRACLAKDGVGGESSATIVEALFETYFAHGAPGMWCDEFDAAGAPVAANVPASMLYHIHEAAADAARLLEQTH